MARQNGCISLVYSLFTVLIFIQLLCIPSCRCSSVNEKNHWPIVQLRTAAIETQFSQHGLRSPHTRRRLLSHSCHTYHQQWGILKDSHQALISHALHLPHASRQELVDHIEHSGASIVGYLPQNTLIIAGRHQSLYMAANHSLVLWADVHQPAHKIAPEWHGLLETINALTASLSTHSIFSDNNPLNSPDFDSNGRSSNKNNRNSTTTTTIQQQRLRDIAYDVLQQLPIQVRFNHSITKSPQQVPLIGIRVMFPAAHTPHAYPVSSTQHAKHAHRIHRITQQNNERHIGMAASHDWTPLLRSTFQDNALQVHSGGRHSIVVFASPSTLHSVIEWLAERPSVQWIAPLPKSYLRNRQAAAIVQSCQPAPSSGKIDLDPSIHPLWAAGITGKGQVIGQGDSGLDYQHCYFVDPAVDWQSGITLIDRVRTFSSETHRKIRLYRAISDFSDDNGHGTHTAGTLAGMSYGVTLGQTSSLNAGMAPDAKIAFLDLSSASDGDSIFTPFDLDNGYFKYTTSVGAYVHSDSWGSSSVTYDQEAAQVDAYCWENPTFLPVFPAGNDGDKPASIASEVGATTVNSPATSKNCIAAGATQTTQESANLGAFPARLYNAKVDLGSSLALSFRVVQSNFSASVSTLGSNTYSLALTAPIDACTALQNPNELSGTVAMVERGNCTFVEKSLAAQNAGAVAILVYDSEVGAYFQAFSDGAQASIPVMTIPRRLGQNIVAVLEAGRRANATFGPATEPAYGFENLASFSSQGPVNPDNRVKPDLVAPGTIVSAAAGTTCDTAIFGGTSMATPVIASSALLVKQYFEDGYYPTGAPTPSNALKPSSALIKAVMVSGATSLQGYEADTGLPIDPPPSYRQGFGRVFLGASVFLQNNQYSPKAFQVVDKVPIQSGDVHQYCIKANGGPLSITLVWTDYPGNPSAARSLVNDLDLVVRAEGLAGVSLLGNGGNVDASSEPDDVNNIETINLPAAPAGRMAVEVRGRDVQASPGPQPYALVINGDFTGNIAAPSDGSGASGNQCAVVVAVISKGPPSTTNQQSVVFELSTQAGNTNGVSYECKLTDSSGNIGAPGTIDWKPCSSPVVYDNLPDGSYTFSVHAVGETIGTSASFTKDTIPPAVTLTARDVLPTSSGPSATFDFLANDTSVVSMQCQISVGGASPLQSQVIAGSVVASPVALNQWYACTTPQTLGWLLPGQWKFQVIASDAAGNTAAPTVISWAIAYDQSKNYLRVTDGPILTVPKRDITFKFQQFLSPSAGSNVATTLPVECALLSGDTLPASMQSFAQPCTSPVSYGQPADGPYKFVARLSGDNSQPGNPIPDTWAVASFVLDSTPPKAVITSGPANNMAVSTHTATFAFTINEEHSTAECSLQAKDVSSDSIPTTSCASPVQFTNLTGGHYVFQLVPKDVVGNAGDAVTAEFIIDTAPPNVTSVQIPTAIRDATVTVAFTVDDGAAGSGVKNITCRIKPLTLAPSVASSVRPDDTRFDWMQCSSPWSLAGLVEGHYSFSMVAYDNAGLSAAPVEKEFWVDTVAPVPKITSGPSKTTINPGGFVQFNLTDTTDGNDPGLGSPVQWQAVLNSISTEQYESYFNTSSSPSNPPSTPATTASFDGSSSSDAVRMTPSPQNGDQPPLSAVDNGSASVPSNGDWKNCSSAASSLSGCEFEGLHQGAYTFQARGIDSAGNIGPASEAYPFQVEGVSNALPLWALIAIIAGSCAVGFAALLILWQCCCRRSNVNAERISTTSLLSSSSTSSMSRPYSGTMYDSGGYNVPSPYGTANGGVAGYGYPYPDGRVVNGYSGAWNSGSQRVHDVPRDPVEAQQLALALAASERDAQVQRQPQQPIPQQTPYREDVELRRAIEASLREQSLRSQRNLNVHSGNGGVEDEELRRAIQESLREQQNPFNNNGNNARYYY